MTIKPVDIEVKSIDKCRENYFKILSKDIKSFHVKRGEFSTFVDNGMPLSRFRESITKTNEDSATKIGHHTI